MSRPLRIEIKNAFYHVIQRGIEKKDIFINDSDKHKFISYLDRSYTSYSAIIHTYSLMNNHYHLILETPKANLSKIMHFLNTSYAVYFNTIRKRIGPLYQGRYKAILIQQDEYLHQLSRYIHLNPVRTHFVEDPIDYPWSSYQYFISGQTPPRWLDIRYGLALFNKNIEKAKSLYKKFVLDGIGREKDIFNNMISSSVLGDERFVNSVKHLVNKKEDNEIPEIRQLRRINEPTLEDIYTLVYKLIKDDKRLQRKCAIYLSRKYTQKTLKEIAEFYGGMYYTSVSQNIRRTEALRKENKDIDILLGLIESNLNT